MSLVSNYFKKQTTFLLSATQPRQYPNVSFPEIAFIGRSNVGKSSLINAIFMKKLAHISNTPGKTRQINFFNHGDSMMVVDLPGYGFAKISQKEAFQISDLVSQYLTSRENLKKIFVLIDNSLGPKKIDIEMAHFARWAEVHQASRAFDGLGMLVEQAAASYAIWMAKHPSTQPVYQQLRDRLA